MKKSSPSRWNPVAVRKIGTDQTHFANKIPIGGWVRIFCRGVVSGFTTSHNPKPEDICQPCKDALQKSKRGR